MLDIVDGPGRTPTSDQRFRNRALSNRRVQKVVGLQDDAVADAIVCQTPGVDGAASQQSRGRILVLGKRTLIETRSPRLQTST